MELGSKMGPIKNHPFCRLCARPQFSAAHAKLVLLICHPAVMLSTYNSCASLDTSEKECPESQRDQ